MKRIMRYILTAAIITACLAAAVLLLRPAVAELRENLEVRRKASVRQAVSDAAFQCYCVEGVYPDELRYLEDHYGLLINHKRYIVSYDCAAANQPPEIRVLDR